MNPHQPKKHKTPLKAIKETCVQCMGGRESEGYLKRISECVSPDCPIYEFSFGNNPYHTQSLSEEPRKERGDRLKFARSHDKGKEKVAKFTLLS